MGDPEPVELTAGQGDDPEVVEVVDLLEQRPDYLAGGDGTIDGAPVAPAIRSIGDEHRAMLAVADPEAIITELDLVRLARPLDRVICSETFMKSSKDAYPLPWLVREIVQNFVDGNKKHPHTLDGVEISERLISDSGLTVFKIEGDWPFEKPTGLISLHSGKSERKAGEGENAGGNGIGLKQTVLRFLRDYGAKRFDVTGEGWRVRYQLVTAEELNRSLAEQGIAGKIEEDWLVARTEKSENRGKCSYEIEVENHEVIKALGEMRNIGVSSNNEFLREPDYESERGSFKWMQFNGETEPEKLPRGRLYINGQVMNFRTRGKTTETYWDGPELVSINFKDLDYQKSLDRAPTSTSELDDYLYGLIGGMKQEELVEQLKRTEGVWGNIRDAGWRPACFVLLSHIANRLNRHNFTLKDFEAIFGNMYLALDRDEVTGEQIKELQEKGYKLCPEFFTWIGVPKASSKITAMDRAKKDKPDPDRLNLSYEASSNGIPIGRASLGEIKTAKDFFDLIGRELKDLLEVEIIDEERGIFKIKLGSHFSNADHMKQMIFEPKDENLKKIYLLRGIINCGLQMGIFKEVVLAEEGFYMTFSLKDEELFMKMVGKRIASGLHVEVDKDALLRFYEFMTEGNRAGNVRKAQMLRAEEARKNEGKLAIARKAAVQELIRTTELERLRKAQLAEAERQAEADRKALAENKIAAGKRDATQRASAGKGKEDSAQAVEAAEQTSVEQGVVRKKKGPLVRFNIPEMPHLRMIVRTLGFAGVLAFIGLFATSNAPHELKEVIKVAIASALADKPESEQYRGNEREEYKKWASGGGYGAEKRKAGGRRSLMDILRGFNNNKVEGNSPTEGKSIAELIKEMEAAKAEQNPIEDFEILKNPNSNQISQLELLREYVGLATGAEVGNNLFIYKGKGALGVNVGDGIGMHEEMLAVDFDEALKTFIHEVAHNEVSNHGAGFIHMDEALETMARETLFEIARKMDQGGKLTKDEERLLELEAEWDRLKQAG